ISSLFGAPAQSSQMKLETSAAFDHYVQITETKMKKDLDSNQFLVVDQLPEPKRNEAYEQLRRGEVFIQETHTADGHDPIHIPGGLIHHWAGVVYVPKATIKEVNSVLQDYENEPRIYKPEIRRARLIKQDGDESKVYLQFFSKSMVTVVLDAYFDVTFKMIDKTRYESISHSTRITEISNPDGPDPRERQDGEDHGYLWRLNSYWRLQEKDGGVYLQNESITLTRSIPILLAWIANPLIKSLPRDVLAHMLNDTQIAVAKKAKNPMPAPKQITKN
ncbi:MAG TPA: hypothetical protein VG272_07190, partial [Candidatus Acidoferrales bacterium]|nr:hypothetical protein [Candidatus Acidoferrales bacterium]